MAIRRLNIGNDIRVRDEKQIELLRYCMYAPQLTDDKTKWLVSKSKGGFTYYDSAEEFITKKFGRIL